MAERCDQQKRGRFDRLRCALCAGHEEPCNFVVVGVLPSPGVTGGQRKLSDAAYEKKRSARLRRMAAKLGQS